MTLINVCSAKTGPQKKMSQKDIFAQNRALNAARRKRGNTRGDAMYEERIWRFLKGKLLSDCGAAGLMGNLYAESGLNPRQSPEHP